MSPDEQPEQQSTPDFTAILDKLWAKYLPDVLERVTVLDSAVQACADGKWTSEIRAAAHSAAHKLAGTLGTFNLAHGTELAREFETMSANDESFSAADAARLKSIAVEIRAAVINRKPR